MRRFLSEYTHIDGTKWMGPDFWADSAEEAMSYAMEYPIQPLRIMGELVATLDATDDFISHEIRKPNGRIH